jgi:hypothetical protein
MATKTRAKAKTQENDRHQDGKAQKDGQKN